MSEGSVATLALRGHIFKCWRKGKKVALSIKSDEGVIEVSMTLKQAMDLHRLLASGIGELAAYSRWHRKEGEG